VPRDMVRVDLLRYHICKL